MLFRSAIAQAARRDIIRKPYTIHAHLRNRAGVFAVTHNRMLAAPFFGDHNFQNLSAAYQACMAAGITEDQFYAAIPTFPGTSRRLQKLRDDEHIIVFHDFAHAPSKVKATIDAVAGAYSERNIVAVLELHTYSSLNAGFIGQYAGTMDSAAMAFVYYNPHALQLKRLPDLSKQDVAAAFRHRNLFVTDNSEELFSAVTNAVNSNSALLLMSSGDFDGADLKKITETL